MANSTLLQLVSRAMQGMGVTTYALPSTVVGNTNQDVTQLLALINMEGDALSREYEWNALRVKYIFEATSFSYTGDPTAGSTTLANMSSIASLDDTFMVTGTGIPQDTFVVSAATTNVVINREADTTGTTVTLTFSKCRFAYPTAFDRPIDRTEWDFTNRWEILGPKTMQEFEYLRSGYISTGPRIRFIAIGNYFQIWPPQGADRWFSFDYLSKYWIYATAGTATTKQYFTVDTDTCIFPDAMMHALIRLKYFQIKGFDTTSLQQDYYRQRDLAMAHDGGSQTLSMAPTISTLLLDESNIPDSGFGS